MVSDENIRIWLITVRKGGKCPDESILLKLVRNPFVFRFSSLFLPLPLGIQDQQSNCGR